ncbi:hypothetical protein ACFFQF_01005 [Haladaptatus pallidirubidus]|uniref:Uncharacterized protein n=1 Tax=Haladaptatus pallidirubidus TaxID=1008152 RepID=A0AAV3UBQ1_9EURY|nr:hypothetical protein [Haladaptatus pallidirubidus]
MSETQIVREPADGEPGLRVVPSGGRFVIEHYWPGGAGEGIVVDADDIPGLIDALSALSDD